MPATVTTGAGVVTATRTRTCRNTHLAQFVGVPDRPQRYAVQEQFLAVGRCRRWQTATHQRHIRPFPVFPSVAPQEFARNIGNQHVRIPGQTAIRPDNGFDILPYTAVSCSICTIRLDRVPGLAIFDPVFIVSETYPRNSGHILGQGHPQRGIFWVDDHHSLFPKGQPERDEVAKVFVRTPAVSPPDTAKNAFCRYNRSRFKAETEPSECRKK